MAPPTKPTYKKLKFFRVPESGDLSSSHSIHFEGPGFFNWVRNIGFYNVHNAYKSGTARAGVSVSGNTVLGMTVQVSFLHFNLRIISGRRLVMRICHSTCSQIAWDFIYLCIKMTWFLLKLTAGSRRNMWYKLFIKDPFSLLSMFVKDDKKIEGNHNR